MRQMIDRKISKNPLKVPDINDIRLANEAIEKIDNQIAILEEKIHTRENSPEYINLIKISKNRMIEIALKAMSLDPKDSHGHAMAIGQYNERLKLTNELLEFKKELNTKKRLINNLKVTVEKLSKTIRR